MSKTSAAHHPIDGVEVPALDIDKVLYPERGGKPPPNVVRERRIVANLIAHLATAGFNLVSVHDGDDDVPATDMKAAMELIFNLDDALVYFKKGEHGTDHYAQLVMGNDMDMIVDYSYTRADPDGFRSTFEAFDVEQFA